MTTVYEAGPNIGSSVLEIKGNLQYLVTEEGSFPLGSSRSGPATQAFVDAGLIRVVPSQRQRLRNELDFYTECEGVPECADGFRSKAVDAAERAGLFTDEHTGDRRLIEEARKGGYASGAKAGADMVIAEFMPLVQACHVLKSERARVMAIPRSARTITATSDALGRLMQTIPGIIDALDHVGANDGEAQIRLMRKDLPA